MCLCDQTITFELNASRESSSSSGLRCSKSQGYVVNISSLKFDADKLVWNHCLCNRVPESVADVGVLKLFRDVHERCFFLSRLRLLFKQFVLLALLLCVTFYFVHCLLLECSCRPTLCTN